MNERQKKLVNDYGLRYYERAHNIETEFLHLAADACSLLTDAEWKECADAIDKVVAELNRTQKIVYKRMKEAGVPDI